MGTRVLTSTSLRIADDLRTLNVDGGEVLDAGACSTRDSSSSSLAVVSIGAAGLRLVEHDLPSGRNGADDKDSDQGFEVHSCQLVF